MVLSNKIFYSCEVKEKCSNFAEFLRLNKQKILMILVQYETWHVACDELDRCLDLFDSIDENKEYFQLRLKRIATFLPKNQPLYALSCFVIIPSLMSREVVFRIPAAMSHFFPELIKELKLLDFFPNIKISKLDRSSFIEEISAQYISKIDQKRIPFTDAVIFTGTSEHSEKLSEHFDKNVLFISNGAGHNPVVISDSADVYKAVEAVLELQLYNQGQDCAAPSSILVHKDIYNIFLELLHKEISNVIVGDYIDESVRVGPISDPRDLPKIQALLVKNREWINIRTPGLIDTKKGIVYPTILEKPLKSGGNYEEFFSPLICIQLYESDSDLVYYFENESYIKNSMYVTLYGESDYIKKIVNGNILGKKIHNDETFLHNKHLHEPGVERGTQPYGGYGLSASSITIYGKRIGTPTCPQRDIFEYLIKPLVKNENLCENYSLNLSDYTLIKKVNFPRINYSECFPEDKILYYDTGINNVIDSRFMEVDRTKFYFLNKQKNKAYSININRRLKSFVLDFRSTLLSISLDKNYTSFQQEIFKVIDAYSSEGEYTPKQLFAVIYMLLFNRETGPMLSSFVTEDNAIHVCDLLDI
jgi:lysyl-tRNA synthetase class 1